MPEDEIREFYLYRHSFPHVPQVLFPQTRPDGLSGQFLHLTQIPFGVEINPDTGLSSKSHQIVIRFDHGYKDMKKPEVQAAALTRFMSMGIPLGTRFREPVAALVHPQTKHG